MGLNSKKIPALLLLAAFLQTGLAHAEQAQGTELRKLLYLVDLVSKTDLEILYDGTSFRTSAISPFVRLFVLQHYKNQSAEKWLREWCSTSRRGNPISVRLPNGTTVTALDLLVGELKAL